jgi:Fic family protein
VPDLLDDLIGLINLDDLPAVSQAAIVHSQFETIHPFADGNGRAGRCLVHVVLKRRGVAPRVVPPISVVLAANARQYIAGLVDFRDGRIDDWVGLFADAIGVAVDKAKELWARVDELLAAFIQRAGSPRSDSVARRIIWSLPAQPVVSAETVASRHSVTATAARAALNRLEAAGVLVPTRVGRRRNREWISDELFQVFDEFEFGLVQHPGGRRSRPAPSPTIPPRRRDDESS